MTTFTVKAASKKKDVPAKDGKAPKQVIALTLQEGTNAPLVAEWFTNASTPLPAPESTLDGDLTNDPQWGWKFAKAGGGGGFNNGPRPEDPQRAKRIVRQHSQSAAIELLKLAQAQGIVIPAQTVSDLLGVVKRLADNLDADANGAAA